MQLLMGTSISLYDPPMGTLKNTQNRHHKHTHKKEHNLCGLMKLASAVRAKVFFFFFFFWLSGWRPIHLVVHPTSMRDKEIKKSRGMPRVLSYFFIGKRYWKRRPTAGLARRLVRGKRRVPAPPPSIIATTVLGSFFSISKSLNCRGIQTHIAW